MCRKSLSISCQQRSRCYDSKSAPPLSCNNFFSLYLSYHNWFEIFLWGSMSSVRCTFSHLRHELSKYVSNFVPSTKLLSLINRCLILSFFPISIFSFHLYLTASKNTISFYQYFRYYCQLCQYLVEEGEFEV